MILEIIPLELTKLASVNTLFAGAGSWIFHKRLSKSLLEKEVYISTPLIVYLAKGQQILKGSNKEEILLEENSLCFFPKDVYMVSDYVTKAGVFEAYLFFVDESIIEKYLLSVGKKKNFLIVNNNDKDLSAFPANEQLLKFFESVRSIYSGSETSDSLLELKLLELLHLISAQDTSQDFIRVLAKRGLTTGKRPISDFMEDYYSRNLRVEDYAALTGRSVSTFIRDFKQIYNTTPNQWLIEKRLARAHGLLTDSVSSLSVTEVAYEVGYENVSHFINAYKKKYRLTPKKARAVAG